MFSSPVLKGYHSNVNGVYRTRFGEAFTRGIKLFSKIARVILNRFLSGKQFWMSFLPNNVLIRAHKSDQWEGLVPGSNSTGAGRASLVPELSCSSSSSSAENNSHCLATVSKNNTALSTCIPQRTGKNRTTTLSLSRYDSGFTKNIERILKRTRGAKF